MDLCDVVDVRGNKYWRCEAKWTELAKHWQCDEEIQNMQNKSWRNENSKECEEALPRLKERDLKKAPRLYNVFLDTEECYK